MNAILEKLYENHRDRISIVELRGLCSDLFTTAFGSTNIDTAFIAFGTFLEVMQFHPSIGERWLTMATTQNLFSLSMNEEVDKSSTSSDDPCPQYQTFGTIIQDQPQWNMLCLCCYQWSGCEDIENNDEKLNENGLVYKYPIYQRIDRLNNKYLWSGTDGTIINFEDQNKIYTAIWKMVNEFYKNKNNNLQAIVYGIYVSFQTVKNLYISNDLSKRNSIIIKTMNEYIKHFLKCEQMLRLIGNPDIQFIYGKYTSQ